MTRVIIEHVSHSQVVLYTLAAVKREGSVGVVGTVRERSTPWGDGVSFEKKIFFRGPG